MHAEPSAHTQRGRMANLSTACQPGLLQSDLTSRPKGADNLAQGHSKALETNWLVTTKDKVVLNDAETIHSTSVTGSLARQTRTYICHKGRGNASLF